MSALLAVLLSSPAVAQPCPDVGAQVESAWSSYQLAELEAAKQALTVALDALSCQPRVVAPVELLSLYRLDALVSLTQDDRKGMVYATLRAVAAEHVDGRPPEMYGPELQAQYDAWAQRLGGQLVTVSVDGGGTVWVDGRPATATQPLQVAEGEHLIQIEGAEGLVSQVRELVASEVIATGLPGPSPVSVSGPVPLPDPVPVAPEPVPAPTPRPVTRSGRRRPAALWLATLAAGAGSGLALASGYRSEQSFETSPYLASNFLGCDFGSPCYPQARADAIRQDALRINAAYGVGYGLAGVTVGLFTFTLIGLPAR